MGRLNRIDRPAPDAGYDTDFHAWSLDQSARLRAAQVPGLDIENLAEEIESLGRSEKRELLSRCTVALLHLLKWQCQAERRGRSWLMTITEQRQRIEAILQDSPSLRRTLPGVITKAYGDAVELAVIETGLPSTAFPAACAWAAADLLAKGWTPGGRSP